MDITTFDTATHEELGLMVGFPPPPDKRVDRSNGLWTAPYNRWAYQHMRRLLPSAGWPASDDVVRLKRRIDPHLDRIDVTREDGSKADFETFLRETFTDSLVVVQGGDVVFERYMNSMKPTTPHQMMSCTKSFVGLFAQMAIGRGQVGESDRVGDVVSELGAPSMGAFSEATFGQVLDMTNSMAFNEDYVDPAADIHTYVSVVGLGPAIDGVAPTVYDYLATLAPDPQVGHGEVFHYQTPKTDAASWVTCRITGRSLLDDLHQLWSAIGADGEAYMLLDSAGMPVAGGGLNATAEDLARFGWMMANDGQIGGRSVVEPRIIDTLMAGGSTEAFLAGPDAVGCFGTGEWSYRSKWWVRHTPGREAICAIGVNGQWIYCDPARRMAIVKQSSQPLPADPVFDDYEMNAFDAIADAVA